MRMKTPTLALIIAWLASAAVAPAAAQGAALGAAQDPQEEIRALWKNLVIQPKEFDQIEKVLGLKEDDLVKARAEIQIRQAQLTRLILDKDPAMDQIRGIVRESLDWELKVRLIQIERQIALRKILGDDRWTALFKLGKTVTVLERASKAQEGKIADKKEAERRARLLAILKRLI